MNEIDAVRMKINDIFKSVESLVNNHSSMDK